MIFSIVHTQRETQAHTKPAQAFTATTMTAATAPAHKTQVTVVAQTTLTKLQFKSIK